MVEGLPVGGVASGARLFATGSASLLEGHMIVGATEMPAGKDAVLIVGVAPLAASVPLGGGLRLLSTPYKRVSSHLTGSSNSSGVPAWNDYHGFPWTGDAKGPGGFKAPSWRARPAICSAGIPTRAIPAAPAST